MCITLLKLVYSRRSKHSFFLANVPVFADFLGTNAQLVHGALAGGGWRMLS